MWSYHSLNIFTLSLIRMGFTKSFPKPPILVQMQRKMRHDTDSKVYTGTVNFFLVWKKVILKKFSWTVSNRIIDFYFKNVGNRYAKLLTENLRWSIIQLWNICNLSLMKFSKMFDQNDYCECYILWKMGALRNFGWLICVGHESSASALWPITAP